MVLPTVVARSRDACHARWRCSPVVVLLLVGAGLLAGGSTPAAAHALLVGSQPSDRAVLAEAPSEVVLTFTEPVTLPSGGLRVLDGAAQRVDLGTVATAEATQVAVALPPELPDGGYVVTYRVVSADSHPVGGVRTFTVGDSVEVDAATLSGIADDRAGAAARRVGQGLRGLGYLALLLATGGAVAARAVVRRREDRALARRLAVSAALAGAAVSLLAIPVQAVAVTGDLAALWSGLAWWETAISSFGVATIIRAALLALLATALLARSPGVVTVLIAAGAAGTVALDGHQRSVSPTWLLIAGDLLHVGAAAVWFGGLVVVTALVVRSSSRREPVAAAEVIARFSTVALGAVVLLTIGGLAMAWPLVGQPDALLGTAYGVTLLVKLTVVAVVVGVAAYNRRRLVPAIVAGVTPRSTVPHPTREPAAVATTAEQVDRAAAAWAQLQRTLRVEVVLLVGVLLVTGVLATTQPAAQAAGFGGLFETTTALGDELELEMVVDPNTVGRNTLHLYVLDATGRPTDRIDDLRLELTYAPAGVGPIRITPFVAGEGHWIATTEDLSFAGQWEVRVVAGVDRFTEVTTTVAVPVAP
ncbi:MAG: copper resistance protein CopC [Nitriliruptoraceae bacterium]